MAEMKKTRKPGSFVCRIRTKEGSRKWVEVTVNPIFDSATGDLKELLTALRDVDERVRSDEAIAQNARQKEILLREIHTRVKNNFAILISLMELQKESSGREGLSRALTDLQLRVRTMSLVHEQLYVSENVRKVNLRLYLLTLVQIISRSYTKEHISLEVNLEEFHCDIELALPVGLIVNELLTNAFKYAFPGKTSGTIRVSLEPYQGEKPGEAAQKGLWILSVKDNGIGLPEFFTSEPRSGMGSQIVRILVDQIEAWLEVLNRDGACFNLVFSEYYKSHA
jgi:two-component sensor histidine kinase